MHFTGQRYRPPTEAQTPLLQLTAGCSHNACAFCTMYSRTLFRVNTLAEVEEDLAELQEDYGVDTERVFLLGGDPLTLPTEHLLQVGELVKRYLPRCESLACYASVKNLKRKTVEELRALRAAGFNDLHIGLETAFAPALMLLNKGCTPEEEAENLAKVKAAGMRYAALLMLGTAGAADSVRSVEETARLLERFPPFMVSVICTRVLEGSALEQMRNEGTFRELTERQMLAEERALLRALKLPPGCIFSAWHTYDLVPVYGTMAERDALLNKLEEGERRLPKSLLDSVWRGEPWVKTP